MNSIGSNNTTPYALSDGKLEGFNKDTPITANDMRWIIYLTECCDCPVTPMEPSMATVCGGTTKYSFMMKIERKLKKTCDIEDPCGRLTDDKKDDDFLYDFVVIGSGPAGSVIANRLTEIPKWQVLLLEAGGEEPTGTQIPAMVARYLGTVIDWKYKTEPETAACLGYAKQKCPWPRGKVLGGTSVHNGMTYIRGSPSDYDDWEKEGNSGWGFRDVLPYFKKSEDNKQMDMFDADYHGVGGYMTIQQFNDKPSIVDDILEAGKEMGYEQADLNGKNNTGFAVVQAFTKDGMRLSASKAFLRPIKNRENFHVTLNATVTKILIDPESKQVYGVQYVKDGLTMSALVKKEVVVSAGVVNSPQLLLLSGIGPKKHLRKLGIQVLHDSHVGSNLHDHVGFGMCFALNETLHNTLTEEAFQKYMSSRTGPMSSKGLGQVTALIRTKYADLHNKAPDLQLYFTGYQASCSKTGNATELQSSQSDNKRRICMVPTVLHPKSRGRLKLKSSDPLEYPLIYANYLKDPHDVSVLVEGIQFAINLTKTKALEKYNMDITGHPIDNCKDFEYPQNEYWTCAVRYGQGTNHHQVGSVKMGPPQNKDSVVDHKLKVYGIKGLRVADASIMPVVISGNVEAPTIMIGERAADFIKDEWLPKYCF